MHYLFFCLGVFGHPTEFLILSLPDSKQVATSRHTSSFFMFQLSQTGLNVIYTRGCVRCRWAWRDRRTLL
jgi:hypothetical protein